MAGFWGLPLAFIAVALLLAMLGAHEAGMRLHERLRQRADDKRSGSSDEGFILSGVLGLLALLMAFSFSMALGRFEDRRELMLSEASAIGNLALLTEATTSGAAATIRPALRAYGEARLRVALQPDGAERNAAATTADRLRAVLAEYVAAAIRAEAGRPASVALAHAYDVLEDTAVRREAMTTAHLPERVLWLLAVYCTVSAAMLGYAVAAGKSRHRVASSTFYLLLSLAFATMLDLDRPRSGAITIPQEPFARAVAALPRA